jgi:dihydrofolate reductase
MKTILWAALTANGNYAQSSPEHPPTKEALDDFATQVQSAGNFIVGRKTFENMLAGGGGDRDAFTNIDIVVVSKNVKEIPGIKFARSPQEALNYLQEKGYETALLSGGADLHNAFLGQGLINELIFNVTPVLEGKGFNLVLDQDRYQYQDVQLLDCKPLGGGIVQLHYAIGQK